MHPETQTHNNEKQKTNHTTMAGETAEGNIKEMGMRKILFEKWDKEAAAGELQKNPDILTKIYLGIGSF